MNFVSFCSIFVVIFSLDRLGVVWFVELIILLKLLVSEVIILVLFVGCIFLVCWICFIVVWNIIVKFLIVLEISLLKFLYCMVVVECVIF